MKIQAFPWLALSLGLLIMVLLLGAGALQPVSDQALPLLTLLIVDEFGFFLTGIGAWIGVRSLRTDGMRASLLITSVACVLLSAGFLLLGVRLWPGGAVF